MLKLEAPTDNPSSTSTPSTELTGKLLEAWQGRSQEQDSVAEQDELTYWASERVQQIDNRPFSFKDHPFLLPIYEDKSRDIRVEKSTQLGLTISTILRSFHETWKGLNFIYWFPTSKLVTKFVQGRYDPLIENNPKLKALIQDTDNTTIKRIGKGIIYFSGLGAASKEGGKFETLSVPADGEAFDEVEKMQPAKVLLALQRLEASPFKIKIYISTPGIPGYGMDALYQESDQKLWNVKCHHCNHDNFVEQQVEKFPKCIEQGFLTCEKCGLALDTRADSEYVAQKPDNKDISGYHVSKLYFPNADIKGILKRWEKAQGNSRLLEDFYHEDLGLPYVDSTQKLTAEDILRLCGNQPMVEETDGCFLGVDVGGSRKGCHAIALKPNASKGWEIPWMGILRMPQGYADPAGWISAEIKRLCGKLGVKKVGIDFQPETMLARSIVDRLGYKGWMIRYADDQKGSYLWNEEGPKERMIEVNRTESLDNSQQVLRFGILLPRRNETVENFAEHCAAVVRVLDEDEITLKKKYVYKHVGDADFRHAFNYACIVAGIDGTKPLTPKTGIVKLTSDSFYHPKVDRKGKVRLEW